MIVVIGLLFLILLGMANSEQKNARFRKEYKRNHSTKELNREQGKYVYYWKWKK